MHFGRLALQSCFIAGPNATSSPQCAVYADEHVRVTVHDDGRGVTTTVLEQGRHGHLGLHLMRDRAKRIGGTLKMWSRAHRGTEIVLVVPARTAF